MTAIRPTDSELRDLINSDGYNGTLNEINAKYTEMDKYIGNLQSDIQAVKEFERDILADKERGYDVGSSLDTLSFQRNSLQIDLDFFTHMKDVYIKKLYGDLYKYCDAIIENALAIEEIPTGFTRTQIKDRKFIRLEKLILFSRNVETYETLKKNGALNQILAANKALAIIISETNQN